MKVSLVIRCYNEEQHIGRLLDAVLEQSIKDVEIIIVDSGSTDGTLSVVARFPVKLLSIAAKDFSFGRSLNIGCRAATSDVIAIASAHVCPTSQDWLEQLVKPLSDPSIALVYGKQTGNEESKYSERQILASWFPDQTNLDQDHPFCNNANAAIRRAVWQTLEYDESLTGLEDTDWAKRAMGLGHKIAYVPAAEVTHAHAESPTRIYNRYRREALALKHIFPQERFGIRDFVRLFAANVRSDYRNSIRDREFWRHLGSIFVFRLMQFCGTYRGFNQRGTVTSELKRRFYYPNTRPNTRNDPHPKASAPGESKAQVDYPDDGVERPAEPNR